MSSRRGQEPTRHELTHAVLVSDADALRVQGYYSQKIISFLQGSQPSLETSRWHPSLAGGVSRGCVIASAVFTLSVRVPIHRPSLDNFFLLLL